MSFPMDKAAPAGSTEAFCRMVRAIWTGLGGEPEALKRLSAKGEGNLRSVFAVSDLAAASIACAGLAISEWMAAAAAARPAVVVDRRLASFWFAMSLRPQGWVLPSLWDPIAGDYKAADGWIRLHTNVLAHRLAALSVLRVGADKSDVAKAVLKWPADALESAIVAAGGCAAAMRSLDDWQSHHHGAERGSEPLFHTEAGTLGSEIGAGIDLARPLKGIKVLDLTRILAGPVATRFLAGYGADVLRIDPPDWDEPGIIPEVMLGKRSARLDIRDPAGKEHLRYLMSGADIVVHGYRPGALERLGFDAASRQTVRCGLVDVSLNAYGWTGPWRDRRGFDSLVQMSCGIADAGMKVYGRDCPTPLPVQALDHATGYMLAAKAVLGLALRRSTGQGMTARTSLARTAALLVNYTAGSEAAFSSETASDLSAGIEETSWGPARRVRPPVEVEGAPLFWSRPAKTLGSYPASWEE